MGQKGDDIDGIGENLLFMSLSARPQQRKREPAVHPGHVSTLLSDNVAIEPHLQPIDGEPID